MNLRGSLRLMSICLLAACTASIPLEVNSEFFGCVKETDFAGPGGILGRPVPAVYRMRVSVDGLGDRWILSEREQALNDNKIYEPGDVVHIGLARRKQVPENVNQELQTKVLQNLLDHTITLERWHTYTDPTGEISVRMEGKAACK